MWHARWDDPSDGGEARRELRDTDGALSPVLPGILLGKME